MIGLRDLRPGDADRLFAWRNSPAVAPYMYTDRPIAPDEHARWFASAPADPRRRYWIAELDGAPVGLVNLYDIERDHCRCAWAYYLAEPATRGRGVGAAIEFAVLDHVFGPMGLNKLWCEVLEENRSVWRLHESFGFTVEARLREHIRKGDRYLNVLGLGLLASDWARTRPTPLERLSSKGLIPPAVPG